VEIYLVERRNT